MVVAHVCCEFCVLGFCTVHVLCKHLRLPLVLFVIVDHQVVLLGLPFACCVANPVHSKH